MKNKLAISALTMLAGLACILLAQQPPAAGPAKGKGAKVVRPSLFFREAMKDTPGGEHPVTQESIASPNLEMKLYGHESKEMQVTGASTDDTNPVHFWTGMCPSSCGAAYRDKNNFVDLTGLARIRWTHKTSGFHQIRPMLKLGDGSYLVGDRAEGTPTDWLTTEFAIADLRWIKLDQARMVTTGMIIPNPDLSKVDEVGFVDLLPGSGHGQGGWSDVAMIEVYGKPVKR
jgi:hypothetical protein